MRPRFARAAQRRGSSWSGNGAKVASTGGRRRTAVMTPSGVSARSIHGPGARCSSAPAERLVLALDERRGSGERWRLVGGHAQIRGGLGIVLGPRGTIKKRKCVAASYHRVRARGGGMVARAVRSRPRTRKSTNDEAAPKSAWGVRWHRGISIDSPSPGPRASANTRPRNRWSACVGPDRGGMPPPRTRATA